MKVLSTSQGLYLIFPSRGDLAKTVRNLGEFLHHIAQKDMEPPYAYVLTDEPDPEKIRPTIEEIKGKRGVDPGTSDFTKVIVGEIDKNEIEWFESFCVTELDMTPEEVCEMTLKEYGDYLLERMKEEAARNFPIASRL